MWCGNSAVLHSGQRLDVLLANQACRHVEPKTCLQAEIQTGASGMGSSLRLASRALAVWVFGMGGSSVQGRMGKRYGAALSISETGNRVVAEVAKGSLHMEQSRGLSRVVAQRPMARKSLFEAYGGVETSDLLMVERGVIRSVIVRGVDEGDG